MAKGLIKDSTLTAIANAIREKTETTATMLPSEMAALIQGITGAKVAYGSKALNNGNTPSINSVTIDHGLGTIPNLVYFMEIGTQYASSQASPLLVSIALWPDGTCEAGYSSGGSFYSMNESVDPDGISLPAVFELLDDMQMIIKPYTGRKLGGTYYWLVGVV